MVREEWEADKKSDQSVLSHILAIRESMEEMTTIVQDNWKKAQSRQKTWYDQNTRDRGLKPGDEVSVLLSTSSNKSLAQWQGSYDVLRKTGKVNYEINMKDKKKKKKDLLCNNAEKMAPT